MLNFNHELYADKIVTETSSVCSINPQLKPYLEFGSIMTETHCDVRVGHLVGGSGRFIGNLEEAFEKSLSSASNSSSDLSTGPQGVQ